MTSGFGEEKTEITETLSLKESLFKGAVHELGHLCCARELGWKTKKSPRLVLTVGPDASGKVRVRGDIDLDVAESDPSKPNKIFFAAGYAAEQLNGCFTNYYSPEDNGQIPSGAIDEAVIMAKGIVESYSPEIVRVANLIVGKIEGKGKGVFRFEPADLGIEDLVKK
ncbi:hypothetical protein A3H89_05555 [Candidatus Amesbacteria bacterium RIFCSPLOWO2_02_FULL_48_11]|uniref:Peptidase M41 domain-containing protein n=2 Tax=Candidatus Amesiibacteriota TaxID=1752730 RepID=A0A0G1UBT9_9BACT|nr:MAG: hypothetical protein UX78_C0025G0008 [Candidatus Amesbacteria bacterium GW2011_GWA2_47_11]KKU99916.1 MAG: hypothetical protein UY33_C0019G0002 [Candidatus Amesbacteria bacterium GW2011_GWA1_48_9]OGC95477.1 MAG: hypothetical protein A3C34_00555 [Candidatus Amesbacteria bacterium RIFCSPHIGHO2_02_FULL_48_21]OGC96827.1 MAG: hypothetical protein A2W16_01525 [Candidatus Amesbacteria bacterium RBG_16_48_31]OGD06547.1 MAG: hypothetical protein A3H89_05555 [Candidatus Amesbacteria bacterium RIFC